MFQAVLKPYLNEWSSNHAVTVTTQLSINIAGCCRRNVHLQWGSHIPLFNLGLRFEIKECEFSFLPYLLLFPLWIWSASTKVTWQRLPQLQ